MRAILLMGFLSFALAACCDCPAPPPVTTTVVIPPGSSVVCPSGAPATVGGGVYHC
jgi:hypothetical protein